jgi:hypothetical protein
MGSDLPGGFIFLLFCEYFRQKIPFHFSMTLQSKEEI